MKILENIGEYLHDLDALVGVADEYLRISEDWLLVVSPVGIKLK